MFLSFYIHIHDIIYIDYFLMTSLFDYGLIKMV